MAGPDDQDPSALSPAQMSYKIAGIETRLDGMDKALLLVEKFPTAIDTAVGHLRDLHAEKFEGVGVRFIELNTRLTEGDRYKQTALDAALKAAQTLVDKQQENNKESIKKTEELFTKQMDGSKETQDDLKGRVTALEAATTTRNRGSDDLWKAGAVVVALLSSVAAIIIAIYDHH